jgi:hypothetical protein
MSPKCPDSIQSRATLRHQKLSHMSNTTISQQTFLACLCQGSLSPNNHRKIPKQGQGVAKRPYPQIMPMVCPETKNSNFRQHCNPLRNTRPCSHVYIWNPEVQRSCCLFPKKTHSYKPNSQQEKKRRFCLCPKYQVLNMRESSFPGLPINESYSQLKQTTPKSTKLEVFHCCFNGVSTFVVQSTQYYLRETLLFQTQVHSHQICGLNQHILTHLCQHCQINIFSMPNRCCFLPS